MGENSAPPLCTGDKRMDMEELKMPQHVAIILDGNGRWAKAKGMPRTKDGGDDL